MADLADERRKRWRAYHEECSRISAAHDSAVERFIAAGGMAPHPGPRPYYPRFPDDLRTLACGAKTRKGQPCKRTDIMLNGRCKFHGGMSTGPKTDAGRARSLANLRNRHRALTNPMER